MRSRVAVLPCVSSESQQSHEEVPLEGGGGVLGEGRGASEATLMASLESLQGRPRSLSSASCRSLERLWT